MSSKELEWSEPIVLDLQGDGLADDLAAEGDLDIHDELTISVSPENILDRSSLHFEQVLPLINATQLGDRIFDLPSGASRALFSGLRLTGGSPSSAGGALRVRFGAVAASLETVDLFGNTATDGSAIFAQSPIKIFNSRIHDNQASNNGAAVYIDGTFGETNATITQSSVFNNQATGVSAAVKAGSTGFTGSPSLVRILSTAIVANQVTFGLQVRAKGEADLQNVTISNNTLRGIGLQFVPAAAPTVPSLRLSHTVLANQGFSNCFVDSEITAESLIVDDFNLSDDNSCVEIAAGETNLNDLPAGLIGAGPDMQSWHWVDLPEPGSLVVESGSEMGCQSLDQRQLARPQQGLENAPDTAIARCDIGAIEVRPESLFASGFEPLP